MNRHFITQIIFPIVALAALSALVHLRWPADGFFLNLSAGFVGSLVTIGYVDGILRRHEKENWRKADYRIQTRINKLASATITDIRETFGFGLEVFDREAMKTGSPEIIRKEVIRVAIHVLSPMAKTKISTFNQEQWKSFSACLQRASTEFGALIDRFGHRLEPSMITTILDLQQHLESAQIFWQVFPDVAGVPVAQLPKMNTSPEEMQAAWCELTARDIQMVLKLTTVLSVEINDA